VSTRGARPMRDDVVAAILAIVAAIAWCGVLALFAF
jgi:phosphatidylglycerophosphatase A